MSAIGRPIWTTDSSIANPRRPGQRAHDGVARLRPAARSARDRTRSVSTRRMEAAVPEAAQRGGARVGDGQLELRLPGEVARDRGPDEAATEDGDLLHAAGVASFW